MNINQRLKWSLGRGNPVVPSRWQATTYRGAQQFSAASMTVPRSTDVRRVDLRDYGAQTRRPFETAGEALTCRSASIAPVKACRHAVSSG